MHKPDKKRDKERQRIGRVEAKVGAVPAVSRECQRVLPREAIFREYRPEN
jgi:hypothetical protein